MSAEKALTAAKTAPGREPGNLAEVLEALQRDAVSKGLDKLTDEEIEAEIAAYRREKRARENKQ